MASISSRSIMDDYSTIGFGRTMVGVLNSYLQSPAVGEKNRKQTARGGKHTDFPPCVVMFPGIQQPSFPKEQISSLIPITSDTKPSPPASSTGKLGRKYKGSISVTFRVNNTQGPSPRVLCTCVWLHGCKHLCIHKNGDQSRWRLVFCCSPPYFLAAGSLTEQKAHWVCQAAWLASQLSDLPVSTTPPILGVTDMPWRFELRSSGLWSECLYPLSHLTSSLFFNVLFLS